MQALANAKPGIIKKTTILFSNQQSWLENLFADNGEPLASSLSVTGKPLIIYNIEKILVRHPSIEKIILPGGLSRTANLLQIQFPFLQIDECKDDNEPLSAQDEFLSIPLNCAILESSPDGYSVKPIVYPWDILTAMNNILETEIKESKISKDVSVAESTIIKGPCVLEEGVAIDDFNKLVGPVYIGTNSRIGTSNLIRRCIVGDNCSIGFGCEVARSWLSGNIRLSHHDVILDTIVGQNAWMGAYVGTTNVLLNNETVKYKLGDRIVSTAREHFGSVIGHDSAIGAGVIILPGRFVPSNSIVQAGTVFSK